MRSGVRSSLRSRDSSSTSASDPREKIKDCCRKLVAFMCTQVGVGGLVVCYAIIGAFGFMALESQGVNPQNRIVADAEVNCTAALWELTMTENLFNETAWRTKADAVLKSFQTGVAGAVKAGYDGRTPIEIWSFPAALLFCLSIFSMIGYGSLVPRTPWGKGCTVIYAAFGIPLYVVYFLNMGQVLASTFRWLYTRLYECSREPPPPQDPESSLPPTPAPRIIVPSTACLWVIFGYILVGTVMFAELERWEYLDSAYYCVTSLAKIGFGDFVPGSNFENSNSNENQTKIIINFVYLLVGMGLIAMCYNLMREEIHVKLREMRQEFTQWLEEIREAKLMYGMLFSIKSFVGKISPIDLKDGFLFYKTSKYALHYFETPSGFKFVLNTNVEAQNVRDILQQIYSQIFVEYVVKNPVCSMNEPIKSELFKSKLDTYVRQLPVF